MHIYQCGEKATSRGVEYQCICLPNKERFDKYAMLGIVSSVSMPRNYTGKQIFRPLCIVITGRKQAPRQQSKGKQREIQKQVLCDSVTTQVLCNSVLCHEHRARGARNPGRYPHLRSEEGRRRRRGRVARERVRHHPDW